MCMCVYVCVYIYIYIYIYIYSHTLAHVVLKVVQSNDKVNSSIKIGERNSSTKSPLTCRFPLTGKI